jgi:histidine ammonia-lyase
VADAERLLATATVCGALDLEAFAANPAPLAEAIGRERPHPGLVGAQRDLRTALAGSYLWQTPPRNLHDPLSFRNLPAILGAARDALDFAKATVAIELNASQENPMVDRESRRLVPTANYEMIAMSQALDLVRIALAPVLTSANERLVKLLQASLSGLSHGLEAPGSGYGTALSELAWTAQALTPEARLLSQPVSTETASTSQAEGTEDRISLAPLSARRTAEMVTLGERLLTIALVVSAQAIELRAAGPLGTVTGAVVASVRERVPFIGPDDSIPSDLSPVLDLVRSGAVGARLPAGSGGFGL